MDIDKIKELQEKVNNDELILFFLINNDDFSLEVIDEYELYGDKLQKLFDLCEEDFELLTFSLKVIKDYYFITKDVVDTNLNLDHPIPFVVEMPDNNANLDIICITLNGINFKRKFKHAIKPEQLNKIEEFFKNKSI